MENSDYYREFVEPSTLVPPLFSIIQSPKLEWQEYFNFEAAQVPEDMWMTDQLLSRLHASGYKFKVGIVKMNPYHFYEWHTDDLRQVSINMLLSNLGASHCLFRDNTNMINHPVVELEYKFKTMYLFNTQKEHCVYNGSGVRFLMTVEFEDGTTYNELENNLGDYLV